jgi:nucleotide-binding universal stress UspA family protein
MFGKILYPTDFSDVSKKALDFIKQLKKAGGKEVIILHILDEREIENISRYAKAYLDDEEVEKTREEAARKEAEQMKKELTKSGFDVKVRIEKGIPFRDILRVEHEENVSVVILGSHGKSCITEMFLGSVSENVIRKSDKPVLVIRR